MLLSLVNRSKSHASHFFQNSLSSSTRPCHRCFKIELTFFLFLRSSGGKEPLTSFLDPLQKCVNAFLGSFGGSTPSYSGNSTIVPSGPGAPVANIEPCVSSSFLSFAIRASFSSFAALVDRRVSSDNTLSYFGLRYHVSRSSPFSGRVSLIAISSIFAQIFFFVAFPGKRDENLLASTMIPIVPPVATKLARSPTSSSGNSDESAIIGPEFPFVNSFSARRRCCAFVILSSKSSTFATSSFSFTSASCFAFLRICARMTL
mmetsp:Transcript_20539/g.30432  ORF Transcript_20539/g.30432 Transcript_20539/m.30432 type:complete len:260 (-) Transcript_20539:1973-2752(-)